MNLSPVLMDDFFSGYTRDRDSSAHQPQGMAEVITKHNSTTPTDSVSLTVFIDL